MSKAIMNPVNKKVAFLTFKIVEETIKRICLKVEIEKLMPVMPECTAAMKKSLGEAKIPKNTVTQSISAALGKTTQSYMSLL